MEGKGQKAVRQGDSSRGGGKKRTEQRKDRTSGTTKDRAEERTHYEGETAEIAFRVANAEPWNGGRPPYRRRRVRRPRRRISQR